ncbi:MAG: TetR/AcrR family transcriptional regulator [Aeromicrobium sp.]
MSPSQADRSGSTRAALIGAGTRLFADRGYAAVPAEVIVAEAGVTRGALYHHFDGKLGLFRAVFEELETSITAEVAAVIGEIPDQWSATIAGLGHFLDICARPEVIRIALTDAPAVLGWQTWRQIEKTHGLGLITDNMRRLAEAGLLRAGPVDMLAQLMLSAVIEAALLIAHAEDPVATRANAQEGLLLLAAGMINAE